MSQYRISPEARVDLQKIRNRILRARPGRAASHIYEIEARFALLASSPRIGRARDDLRVGIRSFVHGNHLIFYRLAGPDIEIVRVIHAKRDYPRMFDR